MQTEKRSELITGNSKSESRQQQFPFPSFGPELLLLVT
jgi:hypothetical protein